MKGHLTLFLVMSCLATTACSDEEVLGRVSPRQSIQAVVVLSQSGVLARREKISSGRQEAYRVLVDKSDSGRALQILQEYDLPDEERDVLEEFTRPKGLVPNSFELSRLRLDHALALEVERLVAAIPGIVGVKAVVRSNFQSSQSEGALANRPTASLVVRYVAPVGKTPVSDREIKEFVAQAVPGLQAQDVTLTSAVVGAIGKGYLFGMNPETQGDVMPLSRVEPFSFYVPEKERRRVIVELLSVVLVVGVAAVLVGIFLDGVIRRGGILWRRNGRGGKRGVVADSSHLEGSLHSVDSTRRKTETGTIMFPSKLPPSK